MRMRMERKEYKAVKNSPHLLCLPFLLLFVLTQDRGKRRRHPDVIGSLTSSLCKTETDKGVTSIDHQGRFRSR
ncbi:hypothetical protein TCAL_17136 [Tigriopus californicus]|uniref:Uncharacterized protein n=1 Tax=Tigriopus californicus TaxID=6832 RepID=A0A553P3F6_TIGCA|nr:hypothetical protein TCAL_17136 [Tigriopus californicus]